MAENIIHLTKDNFEEVMANEKTVVIDFWASWCGPCKMLAPIYESVSETTDAVVFAKVNVDEEGELAAAFGISSIPTLVFVKEKKVVDMSVGLIDAGKLTALVEKNK